MPLFEDKSRVSARSLEEKAKLGWLRFELLYNPKCTAPSCNMEEISLLSRVHVAGVLSLVVCRAHSSALAQCISV